MAAIETSSRTKKKTVHSKTVWRPGNMLYPVPAVMVTAAGRDGRSNIFTVAWTGTVCSDPPMVSISVKPERFSYDLIAETGEFVINLTTEELAWAADFCGVRSGRDTDKWKETGLTPEKAQKVSVPLIRESPVNLECRVTKREKLGTHDMFLAEIVAVDVDEAYMDEKGAFQLSKAKPLAYSHGRYYGLGECLGTFGYSVRKTGTGEKSAGGKKGTRTVQGKRPDSAKSGQTAVPDRKKRQRGTGAWNRKKATSS